MYSCVCVCDEITKTVYAFFWFFFMFLHVQSLQVDMRNDEYHFFKSRYMHIIIVKSSNDAKTSRFKCTSFVYLQTSSHRERGGPAHSPGGEPAPAGRGGMSLCPYGNDVIPSDSKYRLSSINDKHIFDSLRVAMAWFFDLKVRNVHVEVFYPLNTCRYCS